jgi:hypothetical protein
MVSRERVLRFACLMLRHLRLAAEPCAFGHGAGEGGIFPAMVRLSMVFARKPERGRSRSISAA